MRDNQVKSPVYLPILLSVLHGVSESSGAGEVSPGSYRQQARGADKHRLFL